MTRQKAAFIHLLISLLVVTSVVSFIYLVWYPQPLFDISGVIKPVRLLFIVDVVVGPILTFLVYVEGKKGLMFDLKFIALTQIIALCWGIYTIHSGRANLIVIKRGEFNYLMEKFARNDDLKFEELQPSFFSGPKLAIVEKKYLLFLYGSFNEIEPISNYEEQVFSHGLSASKLKQTLKKNGSDIDELVALHTADDLLFFKFLKEDLIVYAALSKSSKKFVGYVDSE